MIFDIRSAIIDILLFVAASAKLTARYNPGTYFRKKFKKINYEIVKRIIGSAWL